MRTVFVIDDDHLMREVLSRVIEKSGYRVRGFQSPLQALAPHGLGVSRRGCVGCADARDDRDRFRARGSRPGHRRPRHPRHGGSLGQTWKRGLVTSRERRVRETDPRCRPILRGRRPGGVRAGGRGRKSGARPAADELSHRGSPTTLRTPLTAMKLALDSLLAARNGGPLFRPMRYARARAATGHRSEEPRPDRTSRRRTARSFSDNARRRVRVAQARFDPDLVGTGRGRGGTPPQTKGGPPRGPGCGGGGGKKKGGKPPVFPPKIPGGNPPG